MPSPYSSSHLFFFFSFTLWGFNAAVADQEPTSGGGEPVASREMQTTPLANKIQNMAMTGSLTPGNDDRAHLQASDDEEVLGVLKPGNDNGANLQASDDEEVPIISTGQKSADMRKLASDSDCKSDDSAASEHATGSQTVAPITNEIADASPNSQHSKLIVDGKVLTIILVGRIAETHVHTDKPVASLHILPLLDSDLVTAKRAMGIYSIPPQPATNYTTVRVSCAQSKRGVQQYKLFKAVYDVTGTKEIKPKEQHGEYNIHISPQEIWYLWNST
ncbi:hypothetical protein M407DRAFT_32420 [Tulasnella calospora MUT 4182]|uniref:Uncharacterized protein n=1 Tax=Tulasnella calospora MUT 4182 TaxID=1051891 RepID=A0A0C3Q405_9AGAM|nr:hypothetical protein M407DRAFT_32420 [Tulasnella calospora MUT 4182]